MNEPTTEPRDARPGESAPASRKSRPRRFLRRLAVLCLVLLGVEVVGRVVAYAWHGGNEYYLLYGFQNLAGRVGISPWQVYDGSCYKFPPNYALQGAAGQGDETAHTNSLGFRGKDFQPEKPEGVFRIVCLGGSSTFGYHNNDDETYPHDLARLLDAEYRDVEVINAGFPYYNTGSIRSLFLSELLGYEPDLITIYSAYNDACWPVKLQEPVRWVFWLQQHSIVYLFLKETVLSDQRIYWIKNKLHGKLRPAADPAAVLANADEVARRYRANLEAILAAAAEHDVPVVVIRQPITTRSKLPEVQAMSYEEEARYVRERLDRGEFLWTFDYYMIRHHRLIEELDRIVEERRLPVVDNIAIVDQDRSRLTTWVHLTAEANQRLAEALRDVLRPLLPASHRR